METMEETLRRAKSRHEDLKADIEKNLKRAKAFEGIEEKEQAALCYMLAESQKKDEQQFQNYIMALTFYIEQHA